MTGDIKKRYAPNLVVLMIDTHTERDFAGRVLHLYEEAAESFASGSDLVIRLDELYDEWKYPQRSTSQRYFKEAASGQAKGTDTHLNNRDKKRTIDELYEARGEIATFMLQVEYRQNSSWQGHVIRLETGEAKSFQSVLELMRMIDRTLSEETA